jgi:copper chaperone
LASGFTYIICEQISFLIVNLADFKEHDYFNMTTLHFKTNIKCNGCINKVTPFLSKIKEIKEWNVDLTSPERNLTVEGAEIDPATIVDALAQAGYKAELI